MTPHPRRKTANEALPLADIALCPQGHDRARPGDALWPVRTREALAEGILDAAVLAVYEVRLRPEELRFSPWMQGQKSKILRALGHLEGEAGRFRDTLDAGTIAVGVALGYLDFRFADLGWREGRPALTEWFEVFAARPEMTATAPDIA